MKKTLLALAVLSLAGSAFANGNGGGYTAPTSTASGYNIVSSATGVSVSATGAGQSSWAKATNTQTAAGWAASSGGYDKSLAIKGVTLENCTNVLAFGTLQTANVLSTGGTTASGSSFAQVVGTGSAQALGGSYAEAAGSTAFKKGDFNLLAGGSSYAGVATNTGVITSGTGTSSGSTGSGWRAEQSGSVFEYGTLVKGLGFVTGDVKTIDSSISAYAGKIFELERTRCGSECVKTNATATPNATVGAGAGAYTNGTVTNTFGTPN